MFDFLKQKELKEIESLKEQLSRYSGIIDLQEEQSKIARRIEEQKRERLELSKQYNQALNLYNQLKNEASIYQETLNLAEYGMYEPHFDFDTSEKYKEAIAQIREKQKIKIENGTAVEGGGSITWNGSLEKGQQMVKGIKKIMLRAFNGECDSFVTSVDWNNVVKMEMRINKSRDAINAAYKSQNIYITMAFMQLKIEELRLAYEYKLKKHQEKEEQRAIREQMREEEKARREIETAMLKAQKEEDMYQKALEKARKDIEKAEGAKQEKLRLQISELEARLQEAGANKERAISMAQQTKRGHVYVISNIGSFGENVYKIGMTRRLDPMDRVRELGDASVPFPFDVHAIIFSEDAPRLENELHKAFSQKRLNLVNTRKEFFNVTLQEIESVARQNNAIIEFTQVAEARDFRESNALRIQNSQRETIIDESYYPENLFDYE